MISRKNAKAPAGIHHWGFTLAPDAKPKIYEALTAKGLPPKDPRAENPTIDRPFVEHAGWDIDGNRFDLTTGKRDMDVEKIAHQGAPRIAPAGEVAVAKTLTLPSLPRWA